MKTAIVAALCALAVTATGAQAAGTACPTTNHPNELVLAGGGNQTAQLGKPLGEPFSVQLANTNGCPLTGNLAGITVHFDAPSTGAGGFFPSSGSVHTTAGTNAQGIATAPPFTANDTAGAYTVDASSDYGSVDIPLWNTAAGLAATVAAVGDTTAQAPVGTPYAGQLQVRVADADGNPVQGAAVSFTVVPGATGATGLFLGPTQVTTGSDGLATAPPLLANGIPGIFMVTASTEGLSAITTFTLENVQTYATLSSTDPDHVARVGGRYAPLVVHVIGAAGQPVQGATVSFSVDSAQGGAGATFAGGAAQATVTTDASGTASTPALVAGTVSGRFHVVATTPAARGSLTFGFRVLPGRPATIVAGAASGESATVHTRFAVRLAVTVTDAHGNAVAGARVVFAVPARGASARFARTHAYRVTVTTDAHGVAVAPALVANGKPGGYAATATAGGKSTAFALVNLPKA
jgi:protocatechuate 3,4-dioxygenase beta subunit